jgi:hypothetical protein
MGHSAHVAVRESPDHSFMEDCGTVHRIEDDLSSTWVEDWAEGGVRAIETYLAKHLAFLTFLDEGSV